MEFVKNNPDCVQQLNTKGCCFLCLETEKEKENIEENRRLFSIQWLLRHLHITSFDKQISYGKDIEVDLCGACENIFNGFTNVLEELEKVQMKLNYFLGQISKTISGSKQDTEKVQVYSKRMTDDAEALAQLVLVDDLRKKLAIKSVAMQVGPIPRISLERIEIKKKVQVKEEVNCLEESNEIAEEEDLFENDDTESSEPEPVFPSLELPPDSNKQEEKAILLTKETKPNKRNKSRRFWYIKIKETGMFKCRKCTKTYRSCPAIFAHYQSVHLKQRFKCDCNLQYGNLRYTFSIESA